ncbi:hypothetical protein MTO96_051733 [Rhipicephalus appendiculatus]
MGLMGALRVVKRRLWLQTVRRHYVAMLLEFVCVGAMSKLVIPPHKPDTNGQALSARPEAVVYGAYEADKQIMGVLAVVYKPRNPVMDDLIKKSFVEAGHSPEVTALMKGPEVESKCRAEWTKYGTRGKVACVEFAEVFGVTGGGSLEYQLLQAAKLEVPEKLPLTGPKSFKLESDDHFKGYFDFVLKEQAKIDYNFLEKAKGSQEIDCSIFWVMIAVKALNFSSKALSTISAIEACLCEVELLRWVEPMSVSGVLEDGRDISQSAEATEDVWGH